MSSPSLARLLQGVVLKTYVLRKRYLLNTVSQLVVVYVLFLLVFLGGRAVAPAALDDNLAALVVGFFVWIMSLRAYRSLSQELVREAQWGTLEQLYLTPFGFGRVTVVQTLVNVFESFLWGITILVMMLVTTGRQLHIDVPTVVVLVALTLASAIGVGFVLGGLALLYKRIENLFALVQFLFVGFISAPVVAYPALKAVPLSLGTHLLQQSMGGGLRLWELPTGDLLALVVKAAAYLVVGFAAFAVAKERARERGVMGHY